MVTIREVAVTVRRGTSRAIVTMLAFALMTALVRPAPARAARAAPAAPAGPAARATAPAAPADTTTARVGQIKGLFGPNLRGLDHFDVDNFHALSATDIFNNRTFEMTINELLLNPPTGLLAPLCRNGTGRVDEDTRPMTVIVRGEAGACGVDRAEGTAVNGQ